MREQQEAKAGEEQRAGKEVRGKVCWAEAPFPPRSAGVRRGPQGP